MRCASHIYFDDENEVLLYMRYTYRGARLKIESPEKKKIGLLRSASLPPPNINSCIRANNVESCACLKLDA